MRGIRVSAQRPLPLGDLQRVAEAQLAVERLLVEEPLDRVVGQLLHEEEGLVEVQEHGEVVVLAVRLHVDALCQDHVGCLLQAPDLVPGDHQLHWTAQHMGHTVGAEHVVGHDRLKDNLDMMCDSQPKGSVFNPQCPAHLYILPNSIYKINKVILVICQ